MDGSASLPNLLEELSLAQTWLASYRPLRFDIAEELGKRMTVRLTHHSTAIEGNTLTQSETQIVLEKGVTIGGKSLKDHLEVVGHEKALEWVRSMAQREGEPLTERAVRELHSLVMAGQGEPDSGAYRKVNVQAAGTGYQYPPYLQVPDLMGDFVREWGGGTGGHPVIQAARLHLSFVTIHPFRDGNGRVGRLLMNLRLLSLGYLCAVIRVESRGEYIAALEEAQAGRGDDRLVALVALAVRESLREALLACWESDDRAAPEGLSEWLGQA